MTDLIALLAIVGFILVVVSICREILAHRGEREL